VTERWWNNTCTTRTHVVYWRNTTVGTTQRWAQARLGTPRALRQGCTPSNLVGPGNLKVKGTCGFDEILGIQLGFR